MWVKLHQMYDAEKLEVNLSTGHDGGGRADCLLLPHQFSRRINTDRESPELTSSKKDILGSRGSGTRAVRND